MPTGPSIHSAILKALDYSPWLKQHCFGLTIEISTRDHCLFSPSPSLSAATASPPGSGSRVVTAAGDPPPRSMQPPPETLLPMPILVISSLPPPVRPSSHWCRAASAARSSDYRCAIATSSSDGISIAGCGGGGGGGAPYAARACATTAAAAASFSFSSATRPAAGSCSLPPPCSGHGAPRMGALPCGIIVCCTAENHTRKHQPLDN